MSEQRRQYIYQIHYKQVRIHEIHLLSFLEFLCQISSCCKYIVKGIFNMVFLFNFKGSAGIFQYLVDRVGLELFVLATDIGDQILHRLKWLRSL